jgi:hypothetical protein
MRLPVAGGSSAFNKADAYQAPRSTPASGLTPRLRWRLSWARSPPNLSVQSRCRLRPQYVESGRSIAWDECCAPELARSVLRHIRVASKQELKDRIMAAMDYFNRDPVVHTWSYKLDQAA